MPPTPSPVTGVALLDPVLGGRIRGVLVTLFAIFTAVVAAYPSLQAASWTQPVISAYGLALVVIEILTHGTSVGNAA